MYKIFLITLLISFSTIYDIQISDVDNNAVSLSSFQNEKILIVNIATGSPLVDQIAALQQLHQQAGDSLVIIAFPSNSFGNESRTNSQIKQFCQNSYQTGFLIASKNDVKGINVQPVFNWLNHSSENGVMNAEPMGDFQKYLIDKDGSLVGVFSPSVNPMDSSILNAIKDNL